jgi:hypothetical protein
MSWDLIPSAALFAVINALVLLRLSTLKGVDSPRHSISSIGDLVPLLQYLSRLLRCYFQLHASVGGQEKGYIRRDKQTKSVALPWKLPRKQSEDRKMLSLGFEPE